MSATNEASVPIGVRAGEYEITGLLGRGGMGTVYAGLHPVIGKRVAIKVLDPELALSATIVDRFVGEARAVNQIRHRNIIDVFAFGQTAELGHYFVMPLLEGENLEQRIVRGGPMSPAEFAPLLEQIAAALDATHAAGIYHRDLKPENIFLVPEAGGTDGVQVLDFGIAKLSADDAVAATRTGVQMGTPLYMSPEQWEGKEVDHRTDVYALGVVLHHALTGRYPFESESRIALMNLHATREPMAPSRYGAPAWVDALVARAMAKDRAGRYESAGELARAFREQVDGAGGETSTSRAPSPPRAAVSLRTTLQGAAAEVEPPGKPPVRRPWAAFAVVVGLFGVGGAAVALAVGGGGRDGGRESGSGAGAGGAIQADASLEGGAGAEPATVAPTGVAGAIDAGPETAGADVEPEAADLGRDAATPAATRQPPRERRPAPPDVERKPPAGKTSGWGETVDPYGDD